MYHDDMDDIRDTKLAGLILALIIIAVIATSCWGCSHAQPAPEEVIPCTPVTIYPPEIMIPERPPLKSAGWTREQVEADPLGFARSVAEDITAWIGWGLELEHAAKLSNSSRPTP